MRVCQVIALAALFAVVAGVTAADGSALRPLLVISIGSAGVSPTVATVTANGFVPVWENSDPSMPHTVVFANGQCSLQLPPDRGQSCTGDFWAYVGRYPYTVDGKFQGTLVVLPAARAVTLSAASHETWPNGRVLTLDGELAYSDGRGGAPERHPPPPSRNQSLCSHGLTVYIRSDR